MSFHIRHDHVIVIRYWDAVRPTLFRSFDLDLAGSNLSTAQGPDDGCADDTGDRNTASRRNGQISLRRETSAAVSEDGQFVFDGIGGSLVEQFLTGPNAGEDAEVVVSVGNDEIAHPRDL